MKFLAPLRHALKLTNLTYPHKNSLSYAYVAGGPDRSQNHLCGPKISVLSEVLEESSNFPLNPWKRETNHLTIGSFDTCPKKFPQNKVQHILNSPELNEYVTALAANLYGTALQKGFPLDCCRKYYCTENTFDTGEAGKLIKKYARAKKNDKSSPSRRFSKSSKDQISSDEKSGDIVQQCDKFKSEINELENKKKDPHIVCVREGNKGCQSPGLADNPPYIPRKGADKEESPAKKNPLNGFNLLEPNLYQKSLQQVKLKRKQLEEASAAESQSKMLRACQSKNAANNSCMEKAKCGPRIASQIKCGNLSAPKSELKTTPSPSSCVSKNKILDEAQKLPPPESKCSQKSRPTCGLLRPESKNACQKQVKVSEDSNSKEQSNLAPSKDPTFNLEKKTESGILSKKCDSESETGSNPKPSHKPDLKHSNTQKTSNCGSKPKSPQRSQTNTALDKSLTKPETESSAKTANRSKTDSCAEMKLKKGSKEYRKISDSSNRAKEPKPKTSSKCSSEIKSKVEDPCKIPAVKNFKSCGSSSGTEDPYKVPPIVFNKPSCTSKTEKPSSTSSPSRSNCSKQNEDMKNRCLSSESKNSTCRSKCGSSSPCNKEPEKPHADSQKACKRAARVKCSSPSEPCDSKVKNPCKPSCNSAEPKQKCGRPPRGDTRPRCKKDSKCKSKDVFPCKSTDPETSAKSKCAAKADESSSASKCRSKTCAPSPKANPKSTCNSNNTKPKVHSKREYHTQLPLLMQNSVSTRSFSDDCPKKPKGDYKPESKRSDEYRRETCENFSWKATKPRKQRTEKPKNCYPEETLEFCPDTACYRVYAEKSGKADHKNCNKKPKANKINGIRTHFLAFKNPFNYQKFYFSSKVTANQEALIEKPHKICTRNIVLPEISENDALISIDSVALSDTDIYMFETGARHFPELTLGNEASGIVQEVGKNVNGLKAGDHVVLESGIPCGQCELCKSGHYNLCNNINFKGFLRKCCIHPAAFCHKICKPIPLEQAALVPQLSLGCNACHQAAMKPNSNVAIIGSCAMTVCAAICAISMGVENICVMCGMPESRVLVEQCVTEKVNCFDSHVTEKGLVKMIMASLGTFPDIVINCSACTKTMNASIIALKPTGTCVVAGFLSECVSFNIMDALMKEIRITTSFRSKNMFPQAIQLLESGRAPVDFLIANCRPCKWNELECAFRLALSEGNNGARKAIVKCRMEC